MQAAVTVTPTQIPDLLLGLATVRPVFLWGAPGIGKSSLVRKFADSLGLECVSLLGTQLAPEDLIGVPQIRDGRSVFCPPEAIARDEPYCLFLDELNAASPDVQKAFYSLNLDRRIGNYELPAGSIVIGAGNRATDNALARPIASALVNRLTHVHLRASAIDWLVWAGENGIHPWVVDYLSDRPDHLWSQPPKTEEPFSTPRSWHMLSDALHSFGPALDEETGTRRSLASETHIWDAGLLTRVTYAGSGLRTTCAGRFPLGARPSRCRSRTAPARARSPAASSPPHRPPRPGSPATRQVAGLPSG